jgi:hypothetical protein
MRLAALLVPVLAALVLAGGAAASPRFAVFDVRADLARASHNEFGDVKVWQRQAALAKRAKGATLVRCGNVCTFGTGWLAFAKAPALASGDLAGASARPVKNAGWRVELRLTARGEARWRRFAALAAGSQARNGVPDVLVVVARGTVAAQVYANAVGRTGTTLVLTGLTKASAAALVRAA